VAKDPKFARAWEMLGAVLVTGKSWDVGDESDFKAGVDAVEMALRPGSKFVAGNTPYRGEVQATWSPVAAAVGLGGFIGELFGAIEHDGTMPRPSYGAVPNHAARGVDSAIQDYQRCLDIDPAY